MDYFMLFYHFRRPRYQFLSRIFAALFMLAAASAAFAQEPGRTPISPAEKAVWRANGFSADEASEWKYYGIQPIEAAKWVSAGINYPGWANQWRGEGFSAAQAKDWKDIANVYTAGRFLRDGFSAQDAKIWIANGIASSERAREYRETGLKPDSAASFWKLGIYPEEAGQWHDAGFGPQETLEWRYGPKDIAYFHTSKSFHSRKVYPLDWAARWRVAGFTAVDAHDAETYNVEFEEARRWKTAGFAFDEMMQWVDSGFTLEDASRYKSSGINAAQAEQTRYENDASKGDEVSRLDVDMTLDTDGAIYVIESAELINRPGGPITHEYRRTLRKDSVLRSAFTESAHTRARLEVKSAEVNGQSAPYSVDDGVIVIGSKQAPLPEEAFAIRISYLTDDAVLEAVNHDVLFFDIVGKGHAPPIRKSSAIVRLPKGADVVFTDGLAGLYKRKDFKSTVEETPDGDIVRLAASRPLGQDMAFSIEVGFLKGYVNPGAALRLKRVDRKSGRLITSVAIFLVGLLTCSVYYYIAWRKVGRDPRNRKIFATETASPDGMDPALIRLIYTKGRVDHLSVASTLIYLAERGVMTITERAGSYRISLANKGVDALPTHLAAFVTALFGAQTSRMVSGVARQKNGFSTAKTALAGALKYEKKKLGRTNAGYLIPGIIISVATIALCLYALNYDRFHGDKAVELVFTYGGFMVVVFGALNFSFKRLLKAPTQVYLSSSKRINGYMAFLKSSFGRQKEPAFIPPLLLEHLPYAMALDIDCNSFMVGDNDTSWYSGASGGFSCADFARAIRKLSGR